MVNRSGQFRPHSAAKLVAFAILDAGGYPITRTKMGQNI